jgi:hydrogenase maturation protease
VARSIVVIGIGNPNRGDDGIGAAVIGALGGRLPQEVRTLARSGDMLALMDDWAGFDAVVCVDAAAPAGAPGRIHRIDTAEEALPREIAYASSHAVGLAEAIDLARTLDRTPKALVVYAVEGQSFDNGAPLSPPVQASASAAADRVVAEVARLLEETP